MAVFLYGVNMLSKYCFFHKTDSNQYIQTQIFREWQNNLTVNKDKCLNCPAIYICGGGCAMQSHDLFGNLNAIDEAFCIHSKYTLEILLNNLV